MNLFKIVIKNMRQRALATTLTTISVSLAVALTVAIVHIKRGMEDRFQQSTVGYEMVVGAKGSPLQLVLNTVFNLDISPGNIPWSVVEKLRADKRVKVAVPFSVGDNYHGFRIIGTTDLFGEAFGYSLTQGRWFNFSEDALRDAFSEANEHAHERIAREHGEKPIEHAGHHHAASEAVIGATVARETGLHVGQTFIAAHGLEATPDAEQHTDNPWTVVGVLAETGTAVDRGLYINLDSFYHIEGHEVRDSAKAGAAQTTPHKEEEKDSDPDPGQVSAVAVKLTSPVHALGLYREINDGSDAMAAFPAVEVRKLFSIVGNIDLILLAQAILIGIVAGVAIAVSIYNSMSERRREIAILRALGARRNVIFAIVVLEAVSICAVGAVLGIAGGHIIVAGTNTVLHRVSGFTVEPLSFQPVELFIIAGCILLGALSGIGPAARAYRTEVAEHLAPMT
jgi:putative ABC transport system permease protein